VWQFGDTQVKDLGIRALAARWLADGDRFVYAWPEGLGRPRRPTSSPTSPKSGGMSRASMESHPASASRVRDDPSLRDTTLCQWAGKDNSVAVVCSDTADVVRSSARVDDLAARARAHDPVSTSIAVPEDQAATALVAPTPPARPSLQLFIVDVRTNQAQLLATTQAPLTRLELLPGGRELLLFLTEPSLTGDDGLTGTPPAPRIDRAVAVTIPVKDQKRTDQSSWQPIVLDGGDVPQRSRTLRRVERGVFDVLESVAPTGRALVRLLSASNVNNPFDTVVVAPLRADAVSHGSYGSYRVILDQRRLGTTSLPRLRPIAPPPQWTADGAHALLVVRNVLWRVDVSAGASADVTSPMSNAVQDSLRQGVPLARPDVFVVAVAALIGNEALVTAIDRTTGRTTVWWIDILTNRWRSVGTLPYGIDVEDIMPFPGVASPQPMVVATEDHGHTLTVAAWGTTPRTPPNVYLTTVRDERLATNIITENAGATAVPATIDTVISYPVTPTLRGSAVLIRPTGARRPVATIVTAYPGDEGHFAESQEPNYGGPLIDPLLAVARGYAVVLMDLQVPDDYGEHGQAAAILEGVNAGLDAVFATGWVDSTRVGVIGHSYGGYMVNVLVARSHRFRAAVSVSGISDLIGLAAGGSFGKGGGEAEVVHGQFHVEKTKFEAPERYITNSPLSYIDSVTTPLLLIHGVQDGTVHISQSDTFFRGLASRNKIVELVRYPEADHIGPAFRRAMQLRALAWFDEYLR